MQKIYKMFTQNSYAEIVILVYRDLYINLSSVHLWQEERVGVWCLVHG